MKNLEESIKFLEEKEYIIWTEKDKQTCSIQYPKKVGNYKYIIFVNGENTPCLKTNKEKEIVEFAFNIWKNQIEFYMSENKNYMFIMKHDQYTAKKYIKKNYIEEPNGFTGDSTEISFEDYVLAKQNELNFDQIEYGEEKPLYQYEFNIIDDDGEFEIIDGFYSFEKTI